jgi:hypothetical protein
MVGKARVMLVVVGVLSGCIDPKALETAPVQVKTASGKVSCQLYTKEEVLWDRAISAPKAMSAATANGICVAEGHKRRGF